MKRRRSLCLRFSPVALVVFAASVVAPRAGLVVHSHVGGDHVHVHADEAGVAPHVHLPAAPPRIPVGYASERVDDRLALLRDAADAATHGHTHGVDTYSDSQGDDGFATADWRELSGGGDQRPWYDATVRERLRQHAEAHHVHVHDRGAADATRSAASASISDGSTRHWHAQLPFHLVARPAAPALAQVTTVHALPGSVPRRVAGPCLLSTRARAPPDATLI